MDCQLLAIVAGSFLVLCEPSASEKTAPEIIQLQKKDTSEQARSQNPPLKEKRDGKTASTLPQMQESGKYKW